MHVGCTINDNDLYGLFCSKDETTGWQGNKTTMTENMGLWGCTADAQPKTGWNLSNCVIAASDNGLSGKKYNSKLQIKN